MFDNEIVCLFDWSFPLFVRFLIFKSNGLPICYSNVDQVRNKKMNSILMIIILLFDKIYYQLAAVSNDRDNGVWLYFDSCRLFRPSNYLKTYTPIQYAMIDPEKELIQFKLLKIGSVLIQFTLYEAIERNGPPFQLNLRYATVIQTKAKLNFDDPERSLSNKWPGLYEAKLEKIVSQKFIVSDQKPYWNLEFHFEKNEFDQTTTTTTNYYDDNKNGKFISNENVYDLCEWQLDRHYWMLNYLHTNCTPVRFHSPILLITHYKSYFYIFFQEQIVIIPKRILHPVDNIYGQHLVRYTKKSITRFLICPYQSFWTNSIRYHNRRPYLYPIYMISFLVGLFLLIKLYTWIANCIWYLKYRQKVDDHRFGSDDNGVGGGGGHGGGHGHRSHEPDYDDDPILAALPPDHIAIFHDRFEDKLPRAIPIMHQRPKFNLLLPPKPSSTDGKSEFDNY